MQHPDNMTCQTSIYLCQSQADAGTLKTEFDLLALSLPEDPDMDLSEWVQTPDVMTHLENKTILILDSPNTAGHQLALEAVKVVYGQPWVRNVQLLPNFERLLQEGRKSGAWV